MAELQGASHNLQQQVIVLDSNQQAHVLPITPQLYPRLDLQFAGFQHCYLVAEHAFTASWPSFEMHPAGDEVLYLLAGRCELLLEQNSQLQRIDFSRPGQVQLIPKGCWHSADIAPGEQCRILFITPGEDTDNRPR